MQQDPDTSRNDVAAAQQVEALRRSRAQLLAIFHSASDGITVQDETGRLVFANAHAAALLGVRSGAELLDLPLAELMSRFEIFDEHGASYPAERLPGRRVLAGEDVPEVTLRFRIHATGDERWSVVRSSPVDDTFSGRKLVVNVFHDITEQRQAQEVRRFLSEATDLLTSSLDHRTILSRLTRLAVPRYADLCIVDMLDRAGRAERMAVSCAAAEDEPQAQALQAATPGANEENSVERVLRTGSPVLIAEITDARLIAVARTPAHLAAMRALRLCSLIVVPLRARGRVLGSLTLMQGRSGRHYQETDLATMQDLGRRAGLAVDNALLFQQTQEERNRLQQVLAVLPEGIATVDTERHFLVQNAAAAEFLGLDGSAVELPGDGVVLDARQADGTPVPVDELPLMRSLLQGETIRGEQLTIHNGREDRDVPLLVSSAPLRDAAGAITGSVVAFQDISAIREFERTRDEFLASASHDLRTPLTAIQGFTQLLLRRAQRTGGDQATTDALAGIDRAAMRMNSLVRELLDVARLQMGQPLELDLRVVDLVALARQEAVLRRELAPQHPVRVESALPELIGLWDGARLERVLANLVGNAVKYSPAGGEILLKLGQEAAPEGGRQAVLRVHDTGMGISPEALPHVFERFYRGGQAGGRIEGLGLGLATVRQIVELHGGRVGVTSAPGEGTTFTLYLPLPD